MRSSQTIADLVAYHRGMGRELAECIVTAAAGEDVSADALAALAEAARARMVADIDANLRSYGAAPALIAAFCAAASDAMKAHLATLAPNGLAGHA